MALQSTNPATNQKISSYPSLSREETLTAVETAHQAYQTWKLTSFAERKNVLLKLASLLEENLAPLASLITREMGKRLPESEYEINYCANIARYYAENAETLLADKPLQVENTEAFLQYQPLGVLLGVMPWNFPFYQVIRFAAPNLMAGNTILLKHASIVPGCAEKIHELFLQAGAPSGTFTNLPIPTEFIPSILAEKAVQGTSLTGSEKAGAAVASEASKNLKRSVLELGGNDPFIVLEDVDLDEIIPLAVKGRMVNNGQSCVASKRFIIVEKHGQNFLNGLKKAFSNLKLGDPSDPETDLGPLSSEDAARKLQQQVTETVNAGALLILGGDRPDRPGVFFNPTILTGVTPEMPGFDQELFGPVATVHIVKDEAEAIQLANHSSYGLGASVFTRDLRHGQEVARQIDSGMVFLNQPTKSQAELPFGGIKNSGWGRELGELGIYEFLNKKLIHVQKQ